MNYFSAPIAPFVDQSDPINHRLKGGWLMNEGAGSVLRDWSGNNRDAAITAYAPAMRIQGKNGEGVLFNGSTQLATTPAFGWDAQNSGTTFPGFTISVWVYFVSLHNYSPIAAQWNETGNFRQWALVAFAGGDVHFYESSAGASPNNFQGVTITAGKWYHLVVTNSYAAVSSCSFYVNGTRANRDASQAPIFTVSKPLTIGYSPQFAGGANFGNARIENLRLLNREIKDGEAWRLYNEPFAGIRGPRAQIFKAPNLVTGRVMSSLIM